MHGENTNRIFSFVFSRGAKRVRLLLSRKGAISRAFVSPRIGFALSLRKETERLEGGEGGDDDGGGVGDGDDCGGKEIQRYRVGEKTETRKMQSVTSDVEARWSRRTRSDKNTNTWCDTEKERE